MAWAGLKDAICHTGTALQKVNFAPLQDVFWGIESSGGAISKQSEYLDHGRVKMMYNANTADNPSSSSFASQIVCIWIKNVLGKEISAETSVGECIIGCTWLSFVILVFFLIPSMKIIHWKTKASEK